MSTRDIAAYSALIASNYRDGKRGKVEVVARMMGLFDRFDEVQMKSFDRTIRIIDDTHAQCQQSYRLQVRSEGKWHKMVQREQISLERTPTGWKISGGL